MFWLGVFLGFVAGSGAVMARYAFLKHRSDVVQYNHAMESLRRAVNKREEP